MNHRCSQDKLFQSTRPVRGATHPSGNGAGALQFQSTRPVRGATPINYAFVRGALVSIHAPRAGRDDCWAASTDIPGVFQSTRPVRGATAYGYLIHRTAPKPLGARTTTA